MELIKRNIHMDCHGKSATNQITLEEDFVIPDTKPDIQRIIFENSQVKIGEVKPNGEHVQVGGEFTLSLIYQTEDEHNPIARITKSIPFKESIYFEGASGGDCIDCSFETDDLNVSIINSRKLSIRTALSIKLEERSIYDEEAAIMLQSEEPVEYRQKVLDIAQLAVCKKDIYRIRQEMNLSNNLPNMQEILWDSLGISNINFRMQPDRIAIQGELHVFVLFEGEGEEKPIRFYENTLPFSGEVECSGAGETMIPDIAYKISNVEIAGKPDYDGEERLIAVEAVLNLDIKLYAEERISLLSDVYGVSKDISAKTVTGNFRNLLVKNSGKCRIDEKVKLKAQNPPVLQILHCEGEAMVEETRQSVDALEIIGTLLVKCMYVTGDDKMPYCSFKEALPFSYHMDVKGMDEQCSVNVDACVEQMNLVVPDSEEIEVKAFVNTSILVFREMKEEIINSLSVQELDQEEMKKLPSMAVYVVKEGDNLWDIGKKYYVPVKRIKEVNGLTQDECKPMDKLLIIKG